MYLKLELEDTWDRAKPQELMYESVNTYSGPLDVDLRQVQSACSSCSLRSSVSSHSWVQDEAPLDQ